MQRFIRMLIFLLPVFSFSGCALIFNNDDIGSHVVDNGYGTLYLNLVMSNSLYTHLFSDTSDKREYLVNAVWNGTALPCCRVNLHGGYSAMDYTRKSLEMHMHDGAWLKNSDIGLFHKFFLNSLEGDAGCINNYFAFTMLSALGLFPPRFFLTELYINEKTQGMYLTTDKPQDAMIFEHPECEFVIRRGYELNYDLKYYRESNGALPFSVYVKTYKLIYSLHHVYSGQTLYRELDSIMDIDSYMRWLAFNTFVMNGDYTNEVFFCGQPSPYNPKSPRFTICVWDYDDLFQGPHRENDIPGSLVYCSECVLDTTIAEDGFLYRRFLGIFRNMLEQVITESYIDQVFDETIDAVQPFLSRPDILAIQFNLSDKTDISWSALSAFYEERRLFLKSRRSYLITEIYSQITAY